MPVAVHLDDLAKRDPEAEYPALFDSRL